MQGAEFIIEMEIDGDGDCHKEKQALIDNPLLQGEVVTSGLENLVASAEDCCAACWNYLGEPGPSWPADSSHGTVSAPSTSENPRTHFSICSDGKCGVGDNDPWPSFYMKALHSFTLVCL